MKGLFQDILDIEETRKNADKEQLELIDTVQAQWIERIPLYNILWYCHIPLYGNGYEITYLETRREKHLAIPVTVKTIVWVPYYQRFRFFLDNEFSYDVERLIILNMIRNELKRLV